MRAAAFRQVHAHGVGWSRRFKSDAEEHDLPAGILLGNLDRVERRIHDANVASAALYLKQIAVGAGNAQHVAKGAEDDARLCGNGQRLVDQCKRRYADRAARPMNHLDPRGQHLVDAVANNGVRLPAADLHNLPRTGCNLVDFARHALR